MLENKEIRQRVFYIGDDPKVGCNCEGELFTVVPVTELLICPVICLAALLSMSTNQLSAVDRCRSRTQSILCKPYEANKKNDLIIVKVFLIIPNFYRRLVLAYEVQKNEYIRNNPR